MGAARALQQELQGLPVEPLAAPPDIPAVPAQPLPPAQTVPCRLRWHRAGQGGGCTWGTGDRASRGLLHLRGRFAADLPSPAAAPGGRGIHARAPPAAPGRALPGPSLPRPALRYLAVVQAAQPLAALPREAPCPARRRLPPPRARPAPPRHGRVPPPRPGPARAQGPRWRCREPRSRPAGRSRAWSRGGPGACGPGAALTSGRGCVTVWGRGRTESGPAAGMGPCPRQRRERAGRTPRGRSGSGWEWDGPGGRGSENRVGTAAAGERPALPAPICPLPAPARSLPTPVPARCLIPPRSLLPAETVIVPCLEVFQARLDWPWSNLA